MCDAENDATAATGGTENTSREPEEIETTKRDESDAGPNNAVEPNVSQSPTKGM